MITVFNEDLSKQEIYANGNELASILSFDRDKKGNRIYTHPKEKRVHVATFDDPVLMTDDYKISRLEPCTKRYTVGALFQSSVKTTAYGNTSLEFEQDKYPGVWGPSIDTLLFCRALNLKTDLDGVKTAVEVGAGSGFISKYLLNNTPSLEKITLIDLNEFAEQCAKYNFGNGGIIEPKAEFVTGNAIKFLEKHSGYDLIVCNPPYIPRPKSIDDNPFEGISLLVNLISNAKKYLNPGGRFITNVSSLCADIFTNAVSKADVSVDYIDKMAVPLKVLRVLNDPVWMKHLFGKGLRAETKQGHDYWQTINIAEIRPKTA